MTPVFESVAAIIGEHAALILCERLGGVQVYVPQCPSSGSPLVLAIGHGPAARLCDAMAGQYLYLPSRQVTTRARRQQDVIYDLRRGMSVREIAMKHGITTRWVRVIRNAHTHTEAAK